MLKTINFRKMVPSVFTWVALERRAKAAHVSSIDA